MKNKETDRYDSWWSVSEADCMKTHWSVWGQNPNCKRLRWAGDGSMRVRADSCSRRVWEGGERGMVTWGSRVKNEFLVRKTEKRGRLFNELIARNDNRQWEWEQGHRDKIKRFKGILRLIQGRHCVNEVWITWRFRILVSLLRWAPDPFLKTGDQLVELWGHRILWLLTSTVTYWHGN